MDLLNITSRLLLSDEELNKIKKFAKIAVGKLTGSDSYSEVLQNVASLANKIVGNEKKDIDVGTYIWGNICTIVLCIINLSLTGHFIDSLKKRFLEHGLFGVDINKCSEQQFKEERDSLPKVPEAIGLISGCFFALFACIWPSLIEYSEITGVTSIWNSIVLASILSLALGFADDVLELRWRYKLILPAVFSLPLLRQYSAIGYDKTDIYIFGLPNLAIPNILLFIYLICLCVFCTNAINIYAGVNGLEVAQSIVSVVGISLWAFYHGKPSYKIKAVVFGIAAIFVSTSLPLYRRNKYPAKVFVGDTYTYFAGCVFAALAIISGNIFSCFIFFMPQLVNFILSLPQLFGFIPCPRHRLPEYNSETKLLKGRRENWNLINVFLRIFGPASEKALVGLLICLQIIVSIIGSAVWIVSEKKLKINA